MVQRRKLSAELVEWQNTIRAKAIEHGLDFFETIYEVVDYTEVSELAALGGFPTRYPHWRFGMDFDKLSKSYTHGLSKIYEMVINTDPCYAYLLSSNTLMEQKLVMAHVYGHSDFFKNNQTFQHTNRRMLDQMANHAVRIRTYQEKLGVDVVEEFIDVCLSLDNLIDLANPRSYSHQTGPKKVELKELTEDETLYGEEPKQTVQKIPTKSYLDSFVNPEKILQEEQRKQDLEQTRTRKYPEQSVRDVMTFLLENAPLQGWQRDVLTIVRDEAYYFAPQGQTKIMNEGWASYWHAKMMAENFVADSEVIDFADTHSGTLGTPPGGFNPYKVGYELFHDIEDRWNKGQFGPEWQNCDDYVAKNQWDKKLGLGRKKIFEVRKLHNDLTFIDEFFTEDFCRKQRFFAFQFNERTGTNEISTRDFQAIKSQLMKKLTNFGQPIIEVEDANFLNRGELLLRHLHEGEDLRPDYADLTLRNLHKIWKRPVHIDTRFEEKSFLYSFDGKEFTKKEHSTVQTQNPNL